MWSKLIQIIKKSTQQEDNQKDEDPRKLLQMAVQEIQDAIEKNKLILTVTQENQQSIGQKLNHYKSESGQLHQKAMAKVQKQEEEEAKNILEKKTIVDRQVKEFAALHQNISNTVIQLESQIEKLKFQQEEIKSKEVILTAKLESANTNKELGQYLQELEQSSELELFEEEVSKIEIEARLTHDILTLDQEFEALEDENSIDQLKSEIQHAEEAEKKKQLEQQLKRVENIFAQQKSKEKNIARQQRQEINQQKQGLLEELLKEKNKLPQEENNPIQDFFAQKPLIQQENKNNKQAVNDFFQNTEKKSIENTSKPDKIKDFFVTKEDKKNDSKNKINDFFKDK